MVPGPDGSQDATDADATYLAQIVAVAGRRRQRSIDPDSARSFKIQASHKLPSIVAQCGYNLAWTEPINCVMVRQQTTRTAAKGAA